MVQRYEIILSIDYTVNVIIQTCKYLESHQDVYDAINLGFSQPILLGDLIKILSKEAKLEPIIKRIPI